MTDPKRIPWNHPRPARVLIVDDHPLLRAGVRDFLTEESNLEVCGEADGIDAALRQVEELEPDLLITDIILKNGNGLDLVERLQEEHADLRILVLSMHDGKLYAERALAAGAMGFIGKDQPAEDVVTACQQLLRGRVYLPEPLREQLVTRLVRGTVSGNPIDHLSPREKQVLQEMGRGKTGQEIADDLGLSLKTVETYRDQLKRKLGLESANELTHYAVTLDLENLDNSTPDA